jgi:hypothetical protein
VAAARTHAGVRPEAADLGRFGYCRVSKMNSMVTPATARENVESCYGDRHALAIKIELR